ncbi:MAG: hypothetical protein Tsb0034_11480 [Ekhidna sp.]
MKVAVIDMGTNTFHLLIAEVGTETHEILMRERRPVKIGEKGINKGEITTQAWDRAIQTLIEFHGIIQEQDIEKVFATATSAVRNANNGQALVEEIFRLTNIKVEVISGIREAELIHLGASKALDFGQQKNLIMDIGGGSIEFIIADNEKAHWMHSFEIGGQRLVEQFHKEDPISAQDISNLNEFLTEKLALLFEACKTHEPATLIGCSGTFDTLSDIHRAAEHIQVDEKATELPFTIDAFDTIYPHLIAMPREERLKIPGMIEMRVEMIVVASVLIRFILDELNIRDIRVSAFALKEGILFDVLDRIRKEEKSEKV